MKSVTKKVIGSALASGVVVFAAVSALASPAAAGANTVTVAVSNASPVLGNLYLGDSTGAGCVIAGGGSMRYQTYQLNVTVPGVYTFADLVDSGNTDMYVAVYPLGGFDPAQVATSCISTGDEGPAQLDLTSATSYTLVAAAYAGQINSATQDLGLDGPGIAYLGAVRSSGSAPAPMWVQGYARASAEEACTNGWAAGWEQWPHEGSGGWVCTRTVAAQG